MLGYWDRLPGDSMMARRRLFRKRRSRRSIPPVRLAKDLAECLAALVMIVFLLLKLLFELVVGVAAIAERSSTKYERPWDKHPRTAGHHQGVAPVIAALTRPNRLYHSTDVLIQGRCPIPNTSGIYGWYFRIPPDPRISVSQCVYHGGCYLLYVGISENLRNRIKAHYRGRTSTLRMTLGSLLYDELGLTPRNTTLHWDREERLSNWMARNAFVFWIVHPNPKDIEETVIRSLDLPLNLDHNDGHPFRRYVTAARKKQRARVA